LGVQAANSDFTPATADSRNVLDLNHTVSNFRYMLFEKPPDLGTIVTMHRAGTSLFRGGPRTNVKQLLESF
jgi:hypothetical protein